MLQNHIFVPIITSVIASSIVSLLIPFIYEQYHIIIFKNMLKNDYIIPIKKSITNFNPEEHENDVSTAKQAESYLTRVSYIADRELINLKTNYSFKYIRMIEYTKSVLALISENSLSYEFDYGHGQDISYLKKQKNRNLNIVNKFDNGIRSYSSLKTDIIK